MTSSKKEAIGLIVGIMIVAAIIALRFFAGNVIVSFIRDIFNFG